MALKSDCPVRIDGVSTPIVHVDELRLTHGVGSLLCTQTLSERHLETITVELVRTAEDHWVAPLLAHRILVANGLDRTPVPVRHALRKHLCFEAGFEILTGDEVRGLMSAAHAAGIDAMLLKGAALAYLYYPAPHLRPRLDTDVLIRDRDRDAMAALMAALGYERSPALNGDGIAHQEEYTRTLRGGLLHGVDVHWKIANPLAFADLFSFDDLREDAVPVIALGPEARAPSPVHMLLLVALHRIAHHERDADLLCMYDLHAIASRLSEREWRLALAAAGARGVGPILAEALHTAFTACPTTVPPFVGAWIEGERSVPLPERFAVFAARDRRVADVIASDVRLAGSWRARLRMMRRHAFPPAAYMRERYRTPSPWALPYLYARRLVLGIPRVMRRGRYR
ncbi:MAG TPA: nucleotidyltransferase family protein [Vicinamibacterales bacterium]|nr:nucleotidyltransferase family protein [Vicinamibacterales bacterium]